MRILVLTLVLLLAGCHERPVVSPGRLILSLETPRTDQGGILLRIVGGPVLSASSRAGQLALTQDESATHLLLVGNLAAGEIAILELPDASLADRYHVVVEQVSQSGTFALIDPDQYRVTLMPVSPQ